jgi:hypothetical protein
VKNATVLQSLRPDPALKPRGKTRIFTQGDFRSVDRSVEIKEREAERRPF